MEHLGSALWLLWLDVGRYPTTEEGLQALILSPGIPGWAGPYLNAIEIPRDPWGCHYKYDSYGTAYQLLTYGADGKKGGDGEAADIISERPSHRR